MPSKTPGFDRLRRHFGRLAYAGVVLGLCAGATLYLIDQRSLARFVLASTCGLLMAVPVVNLLVVFAEEIRRRDWGFAALAAAVLGLLAYAVGSLITLHFKVL